jgi:membrane fusion protein (multidrug efflux system)
MNRNQKIIVAVLTAVILAILGNILFGNKSGKLPDKQEGKNIKYLLALEAENKDHELWISTYGRVITSLETDLSAEVGGRLLAGNVSLRPGTSFQKGDLLFKVFSDDFKYQIKAKRSNFIQLIAGTLPDLQVDLPNSLSKWNSFYESINVNRVLPPLPVVNDSKELTYLASRNVLTEYYNIKRVSSSMSSDRRSAAARNMPSLTRLAATAMAPSPTPGNI